MLRHNCKLYFRLIFYHTCLESSSRAKHPVARSDSRATSENRVEISQLGRARTCQIRLTPLAGSSTTRTEMRNYWEDPEATASSPIPIAPIHPSKRSRRSRPPREMGERHWFRRTLQPSPSRCDRSIDSDGQHLSMIRRKLFFKRYKKNSARDESIVREAVYLSDVTRIEREYVWESVLGDFIVKEFITEGFGDGTQC